MFITMMKIPDASSSSSNCVLLNFFFFMYTLILLSSNETSSGFSEFSDLIQHLYDITLHYITFIYKLNY